MFYELRKPVYFSCNVNMAKTAITKYCIMVYKMIYCRSMVWFLQRILFIIKQVCIYQTGFRNYADHVCGCLSLLGFIRGLYL